MFKKIVMACGMGTALLGLVSAPSAWATTNANHLPWSSPAEVASGVPVTVSSILPCPPPPNPGDQVLVQIFLSFGPAGGSNQIVNANSDGSWSGQVTFGFSGVSLRSTQISASCMDYTGVTGITYAQYQTHRTRLAPS